MTGESLQYTSLGIGLFAVVAIVLFGGIFVIYKLAKRKSFLGLVLFVPMFIFLCVCVGGIMSAIF